jgi:membrane protease YdiL (CAAX protease family)
MGWLALVLLLIPYFALASATVTAALRRTAARIPGAMLLAGALVVPYVLAAWPSAGEPADPFVAGLARMIGYVLAPALLLVLRQRGPRPDLLDLLAVLALWFPIEFDWLPHASLRLAPRIEIPLPKLVGVDLALLGFLVLRPLDGVGYRFRITGRDAAAAAVAFLAFVAVALPLSFAIGFVAWRGLVVQPGVWALALVGIYLLIAIPEELLFRGVIQNLIERRWGRSTLTLLAACVVFGASHLNNATGGHPVPNVAYMVLATLAGLAYGWVWRTTGKLTAAALTHAFVDWLWGIALKA